MISCSTDDLGKAAGERALSWWRHSLHLQHRDCDVIWHEAPLPHDLLQLRPERRVGLRRLRPQQVARGKQTQIVSAFTLLNPDIVRLLPQQILRN